MEEMEGKEREQDEKGESEGEGEKIGREGRERNEKGKVLNKRLKPPWN